MSDDTWTDAGAAADLAARPVQEVLVGRTKVALTCKDGVFSAISGVCNHVGGPLGKGGSTATTWCVRGTTGSSTAAPGSASPATRRTPCPPTT
jgi:nitrite reductase/ring-hydroxylating ferredoxin subunit